MKSSSPFSVSNIDIDRILPTAVHALAFVKDDPLRRSS